MSKKIALQSVNITTDVHLKQNLLKENENLKNEIRQLKSRKKYGLVWDSEREPEKVVESCKEKLPILTEDSSKEVKTDSDKPVNVLIEGDNYHALSVLNYTHKEKVDLIYIDPPYNTGNEGFIYNDKIVEREDFYRHSKWISFMEKRLKLAKNLLKKSGAIFISIDENEFAQLKLLMDDPDLFGGKNLVGIFTWIRKRKPSHLDAHVRKNTEFILCYARRISEFKALKSSTAEDDKPYPFYNSGNSRGTLIFPASYVRAESLPDGLYKAGKFPDKKTNVELLNDVRIKNGVVITPFKLVGEWRYSQQTLNDLLSQKERIVIKGKRFKPYYIRKLTGSIEELKNTMTILGSIGKHRRILEDENIEPELLVGTNEDGEEELNQFGLKVKFNNPKPVSLISFLARVATAYNKSAVILDFMAGSGTTGQAILELNKEDNGKRQFILCTNNDNNICVDVCYPRVNKVMKGYKNLKGEDVQGFGGNLKYFRTDFVEGEATDKNKKRLVDKSTEMLCLKENCFEEVARGQHFKAFKSNIGKYLGIIYDDGGIESFKKEVKKLNKKFVVYVFSLDESAREEEFEDVKNLVELRPIPAVILNVYKRIFK